jgi:ribosomal protein S18 acetylase RimI-like enzyme
MDTIAITRVTPPDLPALQHISRQTFVDTFAPHNTEEDMQQYLAESFSTQRLNAELQFPGAEFYFARIADRVVGYIKVNTGAAQTELQDGRAMEIERIYVLKAYHGLQVGQRLYEKAVQLARDKGLTYIWLGVWEKNGRALRFYEKNGFLPFDKHIFRLGSDEQTDIMVKKTLA